MTFGLPVTLCPVRGFPTLLGETIDFIHSRVKVYTRDYYGDSVTLRLSAFRSSRIPSILNVIGTLRLSFCALNTAFVSIWV